MNWVKPEIFNVQTSNDVEMECSTGNMPQSDLCLAGNAAA